MNNIIIILETHLYGIEKLVIITELSRYKVDSKNSLSDSALNYRDQLTSSLIVVPVADWPMDWRYAYLQHIWILDCRVNLCLMRQINSVGNS